MSNINFCPKLQVLIDQKNSIHPGYEQEKTIDEIVRPEKPLWISPQGSSSYIHSVISEQNLFYD